MKPESVKNDINSCKGEKMKKNAHPIYKVALFCFVLCTFLPNAQAFAYDVKTGTRLVADLDNRESVESGRIPLILIHGFTGSDELNLANLDGSTSAEKAYFSAFIEYFYSTSSLGENYDLFRFHYKSNLITNSVIAKDLQLWMDDMISSGEMQDKKVVLVGHSMGGLISRAYMEENTHDFGEYNGRKCGERVYKLITLGTPHHGSQAANDDARDPGIGWETILDAVDTVFWYDVGINDPSRTDLKWDNYNSMSGITPPGYEGEKNTWLAGLNESAEYTSKIIAFSGGVYDETGELDTGYTYWELWEQLKNSSPNEFSGLLGVCEGNGFLPAKNSLYPFKGPYNENKNFDMQIKLCFTGVLLEKMYNMNNDGLVPLDSAEMEGMNPENIHRFHGYDHWEMKSDRAGQQQEVFLQLQKDLERIVREIKGYTLEDVIRAGMVLTGAGIQNPLLYDADMDNQVEMEDMILILETIAGIR